MGRHAGNPTPWALLTEAALAYADAESDEDSRKAADRLRLAAKRYREGPRPVGRPRIEVDRPETGTARATHDRRGE